MKMTVGRVLIRKDETDHEQPTESVLGFASQAHELETRRGVIHDAQARGFHVVQFLDVESVEVYKPERRGDE